MLFFCKSKLLDGCVRGFGGIGVAAQVIEVAVWMWSGVMAARLLVVGVGGSSSWLGVFLTLFAIHFLLMF